jgi:hypothetical protein
MQRLLFVFLAALLLLLAGMPAGAETHVNGYVSGTWDVDGSPYLVEGHLTVHQDSLLFIKPGVWVIFQGPFQFNIYGQIIAWGWEGDSIIFTAPGNQTWHGFRFYSSVDTSQFYYSLFEKADNYPNGYGGAFYTINSDIVVEHCTFQHNRAQRGGGMYVYLGYARFRYNLCWDNYVSHCGGAINFAIDTPGVIERCVFYDNFSPAPYYGGAIYFWDNNCKVINCTIAQNSSPAVFCYNGGTSPFFNCIFWYNDTGNIFEARYTDSQGGWPGPGNLNADPLFTDPLHNNFHLLPDSPCIDAGNPDSPLDPDGSRADMGAYYDTQIGPGNDLLLEVDPDTMPVIIPPQGRAFAYTVTITNVGEEVCVFDFWVKFKTPDGEILPETYFYRPEIQLQPGFSIIKHASLYIPPTTPPGTYQYRGYLGQWPDTNWAFDSFEFEKLPGGSSQNGTPDDFVFSGWDIREGESHSAVGEQTANRSGLKHYPEPFNPTTAISYQLSAFSQVNLRVYDLAGRLVATLVDGWREAGMHEVTFDATGLAAGVYLYHLETAGQSVSGKMVLLK